MRPGRCVLTASAIAGLVVSVVLFILSDSRREKASAARKEWPRNVAHRGSSVAAPENTLEAFRMAREAGAGGLELDVHPSSDGHLIVIHDATLGRTTEGSGAVRDRTLRQLRSLDAGYRFARREGYPYRGLGVRIPTLREVLEEFPGMTVNLDIKEAAPGIEQAVLDEIDRAGARRRVLVASQELRVISRFRKLRGGAGAQIATAASKWEVAWFYALGLLRLEGLADPPCDAIQVPVRYRGIELATARLTEAAHARGVRLDVWTIDEPREMHRLLDLGADSIMTNDPGELRRVLEAREDKRAQDML